LLIVFRCLIVSFIVSLLVCYFIVSVLAGGLLQNSLYCSLVRSGVSKVVPNATFVFPSLDPAHGAALLAFNKLKKL
jgi:hypothetical protein